MNGGMYLMSKDIEVALINFDTNTFKVYKPDLMPFDLRGKGVDLYNVRDWLSDRVLSISRSNAKKIVSALKLNQNNRIQICLACKGLSLSDCYWLKAFNDTESTWENVNLYRNSLNKAIAQIALTGNYVTIQGKIRTPELTGQGVYAKCWKRMYGDIYLCKSGSRMGKGNEALVEILCSDILEQLDINHVDYIQSNAGGRIVSRCRNIANENISICEIDSFRNYCNRENLDLNKWLESQKLYFQMLIVDYLILNEDRHSGNWGIYFDANTGKPLRLHPLFDHNGAFDNNGDKMSKAIDGMTLKEAAKYGKTKVKVNTYKLETWLKDRATKFRFRKIFGRDREYNEFIHRIKEYKSWG